MYVGVLEAPNPSKIEPSGTQGVPKRALWHPRGSRMSTLVTQGGPKRSPWSPKGGPKVDKNGSRGAFGPQGGSKTQTRPRTQFEGPAFLAPLAARGRSKVPFWTPGGVPKRVQNRHGDARSAPLGTKVGQKALQKGVLKWDRKSDRKGVPK